jgi:hypothetical protein
VVLAALGWPARRALLDTVPVGSLRVHESTVSLECKGSAGRLPAMAGKLVCVVEAMSAARTPAPTLAAAMAGEPLDAVRLLCLETLVREYPGRPECVRACEAALEDSSPLLRLKAAAVIGKDRGFAVLAGLVRSPELAAPLRAAALDALPADCSAPDLVALLAASSPPARRRSGRPRPAPPDA